MIRKHFSARRSVVAIAAAASLIVGAAPAVSASPLDGLAAFGTAGSVEAGVIDDAAIAALLQQPGVDQMKVRELAEDPETTPGDIREVFGSAGIDIEKFIADFEAFIAKVRAFFEELFGQNPVDPDDPVDPDEPEEPAAVSPGVVARDGIPDAPLSDGQRAGIGHINAYYVICQTEIFASLQIIADTQNDGVHGIDLFIDHPEIGSGKQTVLERKEYAPGTSVEWTKWPTHGGEYWLEVTYTDAEGQVKERIFDLHTQDCAPIPTPPEEA